MAKKPKKKSTWKIEFNHVMIYVTELNGSIAFYRNGLGFQLIDIYPGMYTRLRSPYGKSTIALHVTEEGQTIEPASEGLRIYLEVSEIRRFCKYLEKKGIKIDKPPKKMPWGWTHAYLRDPDRHEISLYSAGNDRLRKRKGIESYHFSLPGRSKITS